MRKFKVHALVLMAMLAFSAVATSAASADEFTAEKYPVMLTGTSEGTPQLSTTAGAVACSNSAFTATVAGATTSATVTASLTGCTTAGVVSVVSMNGCTFKFNIEGGVSTMGDVDLLCPAGSEVTVTLTPASGTSPCTIHIKAQSDIGGAVKVTNIGVGTTRENTADLALSGIDYTHTAGTGLAKCTAGSGTTGTLSMKSVLTGETDPSGVHVGIFLS